MVRPSQMTAVRASLFARRSADSSHTDRISAAHPMLRASSCSAPSYLGKQSRPCRSLGAHLFLMPPCFASNAQHANVTRAVNASQTCIDKYCWRRMLTLSGGAACDESTPKLARVRSVVRVVATYATTAGEFFGSISTSNAYAPQKGSRR